MNIHRPISDFRFARWMYRRVTVPDLLLADGGRRGNKPRSSWKLQLAVARRERDSDTSVRESGKTAGGWWQISRVHFLTCCTRCIIDREDDWSETRPMAESRILPRPRSAFHPSSTKLRSYVVDAASRRTTYAAIGAGQLRYLKKVFGKDSLLAECSSVLRIVKR